MKTSSEDPEPAADQLCDPNQAFAAALAALQRGEPAAARALCAQALGHWPRHAYFWNLLGSLYARSQDARAAQAFATAVEIQPQAPGFRRNLADWLRHHGALAAAMPHYRLLLAQADDPALRKQLARFCMQADALDYVDELLAPLKAAPDASVLEVLAKTRLLQGDWRAANALYAEALWRRRGKPVNLDPSAGPPPEPPPPEPLLPHKLRHDLQQGQYLAARGLLPPGRHGPLQDLQQLWQQHLRGRPLPRFQSFNSYIAPLPEEPQPTLNPALDPKSLEREFASQGVIAVDQLLRPEVCAKLYDYCLTSTIWHDGDKGDGYLGSMMEDGLTGELLYQLAHELRDRLPGIFRGLPLRYMWAFKYDSTRRGIRLHGDPAVVNVNFWITPDSANLDPASGGLLVYPVKVPPDWDFAAYNLPSATEKMYAYLAARGCEPLRVPYRCNRAVIFDSDMFHATDYFMFKDDYEDRRINLTLLYGRRGQ